MAERTLAQKLAIKPGYRVALLNAPRSVAALTSELSTEGTTAVEPSDADAVLLFVTNRSELARFWPTVGSSVRSDAPLWIVYPKRASEIPTDLSRDHGWEPVIDAGLDAVSQISLDGTWSAIRFRRDPALRAERAARGRPGPGHRPA